MIALSECRYLRRLVGEIHIPAIVAGWKDTQGIIGRFHGARASHVKRAENGALQG